MSNMADAAAARREARRRKILENSHNRLQIISGKSSDGSCNDTPIRTVIPDPEYSFPATTSSSSHSNLPHNGVLFNQPEPLFELLSSTRDIDAAGDGDLASDLAPFLTPTGLVPPMSEPTEVPKLSLWEKIVTYKYDIVFLSLFLQMLYGISLITFDSGYFFLPVIVYIVTKLIWFPTQSSSSIANVLMLLNGMTPTGIQRILYLSQLFGVITRDIFVYLFTTICIQSLWITLKDNLVT